MTSQQRVEYGDWQTPLGLAHEVLELVARMTPEPATVLESTCGEGAFLVAAAQRFPASELLGYELNQQYAKTARAQVPAGRSRVSVADFFSVDWSSELRTVKDPILVIGNPPWVTSAQLGLFGSANLPQKTNFKGLNGLAARTGKSNFDVSEWMLLRLIQALENRQATFAVLCKSAVARRVLEFVGQNRLRVTPGGLWRFSAMQHFSAAVDAVLFVLTTGKPRITESRWPVYATLDAHDPESWLGIVDGLVVADIDRFLQTRCLVGNSIPE